MSRKILVIDDEPRLANSLTALLRGAGFDVRAAIGGDVGLKALAEEEFDLVITDLRMNDVDGFEIMRYLQSDHPKCAIIVITGHASTESAIEAIHQNVHDYIPKPFDFDFLKASVDKVFARLETERLKADMARMFSHDIKVPLTSVIGFADFLVKPDGSAHGNQAEFARKISSNARKILMLLENYLTNARVEEGHLEIQREPVCLASILNEAVRVNEYEFSTRDIVPEISIAGEAKLEGDEPLLFRAFANILSNAAKYAPEGARAWAKLTIEEADGARTAHVLIGNNGVTLKQEECDSLFERYRRGRTSRGTGGTGLGLHVVRIVTEAHGGSVRCITRPDFGEIEFEVTLPLGKA
jgi:signal transduction histidine kinase